MAQKPSLFRNMHPFFLIFLLSTFMLIIGFFIPYGVIFIKIGGLVLLVYIGMFVIWLFGVFGSRINLNRQLFS